MHPSWRSETNIRTTSTSGSPIAIGRTNMVTITTLVANAPSTSFPADRKPILVQNRHLTLALPSNFDARQPQRQGSESVCESDLNQGSRLGATPCAVSRIIQRPE